MESIEIKIKQLEQQLKGQKLQLRIMSATISLMVLEKIIFALRG